MITVENKKIKWIPNMTVHSLLKEIEPQYDYAVIILNGKRISKPNFESTKITDNSKLTFLPIIAGG